MTDQGQQNLDNDRIIDTNRLLIPSLAGSNTLLTSLQLDLPNDRIAVQVQVKTRYPFSADLFVTHRFQQQYLNTYPQQLLKLALGPSGLRFAHQTLESRTQRRVAGEMDIPAGIQTEAIEQRRITGRVVSVISIIEGRVFKESAGSKGKGMSQAPASMLA